MTDRVRPPFMLIGESEVSRSFVVAGTVLVLASAGCGVAYASSATTVSSRPTLVTQRVMSDYVYVDPGGDGEALANCPDGWQLTGGGFNLSGAMTITESAPGKPPHQWWLIGAHNSTDAQRFIIAWAECAQLQ